jgi:hypothetical protein
VLAELGVGVEACAGVVEIDVAAGVEAGEVAAAELVEDCGVAVARVRAPERRLPFLQRRHRLPVG